MTYDSQRGDRAGNSANSFLQSHSAFSQPWLDRSIAAIAVQTGLCLLLPLSTLHHGFFKDRSSAQHADRSGDNDHSRRPPKRDAEPFVLAAGLCGHVLANPDSGFVAKRQVALGYELITDSIAAVGLLVVVGAIQPRTEHRFVPAQREPYTPAPTRACAIPSIRECLPTLPVLRAFSPLNALLMARAHFCSSRSRAWLKKISA